MNQRDKSEYDKGRRGEREMSETTTATCKVCKRQVTVKDGVVCTHGPGKDGAGIRGNRLTE